MASRVDLIYVFDFSTRLNKKQFKEVSFWRSRGTLTFFRFDQNPLSRRLNELRKFHLIQLGLPNADFYSSGTDGR